MTAQIDRDAVKTAVKRLHDEQQITVTWRIEVLPMPARLRGPTVHAEFLFATVVGRPAGVDPMTVAGAVFQALRPLCDGRLRIL